MIASNNTGVTKVLKIESIINKLKHQDIVLSFQLLNNEKRTEQQIISSVQALNFTPRGRKWVNTLAGIPWKIP
jgi:hypothetical protein